MGRVAVCFEVATAVIISLTLLGQVLELKARAQTSAAIQSLFTADGDGLAFLVVKLFVAAFCVHVHTLMKIPRGVALHF